MNQSRQTMRAQRLQGPAQALLEALELNTKDDGLRETPARYAKALAEYTVGYGVDPQSLLKTFEGVGYDQLVSVRRIQFYSLCEHHMAPFFGTATIGYIPGEEGRVVGLSKLARLLECFARRLQVQERLTQQVADALKESDLRPRGVGVVVRARHMCMESRGVNRPGCETTTSVFHGLLREESTARAEFMALDAAP